MGAQTEMNPYDVLGIQRSAALAEARTAYRKLSLKWHPDRNAGCGKECDHKMSEITKAFDLVKRRQDTSVEKTWNSWMQEIGQDWWLVVGVVGDHWRKEDREEAAAAQAG